MLGTLDIMVNRFDPNQSWIVTGQTLRNPEDPDELPEHYATRAFYDQDEGGLDGSRDRALAEAERMGCDAIRNGETRKAVVFLGGNEYALIKGTVTVHRTL